jgi:hypothetical protein
VLLGAVLETGIGIGIRQVGDGWTGQSASGQGEAGQCVTDSLQLALGIGVLRRVALGRYAEQESAGQQRDDDQDDGQFDQREAVVAVRWRGTMQGAGYLGGSEG